MCCSKFPWTYPHSSANEAVCNSRDTVARLRSPNVSWFKKILKKSITIRTGAKPKHRKGLYRAPLGQARLRQYVPGKSGTIQISCSFSIKDRHVQMRIYGTHSQLLHPGEKMQFNALCPITGYTWIVLVFWNAIRSDCICAT